MVLMMCCRSDSLFPLSTDVQVENVNDQMKIETHGLTDVGTYLNPWLVGVRDLVRLDVLHDTDGRHHQLDAGWWVLHGLHDGDVLWLDIKPREKTMKTIIVTDKD